MGKIEDIIFDNYRNAIVEGNLHQAQKAVELAKILRSKIELEGFSDYPAEAKSPVIPQNSFFEPFIYKYYPENNYVLIDNAGIFLTPSENKLFYLFSANETAGNEFKIISKTMIRAHLWKDKKVT